MRLKPGERAAALIKSTEVMNSARVTRQRKSRIKMALKKYFGKTLLAISCGELFAAGELRAEENSSSGSSGGFADAMPEIAPSLRKAGRNQR